MPIANIDWRSPRTRLAAVAGKKKAAKAARPVPEVNVEEFFAELRDKAPKAVVWQLVPGAIASSSTETCVSDEEFTNQCYMMKTLYDSKHQSLNPDDLLRECTRITSGLDISDEHIASIENLTREQNQSPLWYSVRDGRLTASSFGKFKPGSPLTVSTKDIDDFCNQAAAGIYSNSMQWGLQSEQKARSIFLSLLAPFHKTLVTDRRGFYVSKAKPYLGASPDGFVTCSCHDAALIEIKCPYSIRNDVPEKAPYLVTKLHRKELDRNSEYYAQIQGQLAVVGVGKCYFTVWTLAGIYIELICFDAEYWQKLVKRLEEVFVHFIMPVLLTGESTEVRAVKGTQTYHCKCKQQISGRLIRCDYDNCCVGFYHYSCVNITRRPAKKWYCSLECSSASP